MIYQFIVPHLEYLANLGIYVLSVLHIREVCHWHGDFFFKNWRKLLVLKEQVDIYLETFQAARLADQVSGSCLVCLGWVLIPNFLLNPSPTWLLHPKIQVSPNNISTNLQSQEKNHEIGLHTKNIQAIIKPSEDIHQIMEYFILDKYA